MVRSEEVRFSVAACLRSFKEAGDATMNYGIVTRKLMSGGGQVLLSAKEKSDDLI